MSTCSNKSNPMLPWKNISIDSLCLPEELSFLVDTVSETEVCTGVQLHSTWLIWSKYFRDLVQWQDEALSGKIQINVDGPVLLPHHWSPHQYLRWTLPIWKRHSVGYFRVSYYIGPGKNSLWKINSRCLFCFRQSLPFELFSYSILVHWNY